MIMEIFPFTKPYTSSSSAFLGRTVSSGSSTLPLLPDNDSYLDKDADDERVERVVRNVVGFTSSGRHQQHRRRKQRHYECGYERRPRVCTQIAFQMADVRMQLLLCVE